MIGRSYLLLENFMRYLFKIRLESSKFLIEVYKIVDIFVDRLHSASSDQGYGVCNGQLRRNR